MFKKRVRFSREINPDEIFVDSVNPSNLDLSQMEGRMEKPLSSNVFWGMGLFFVLVAVVFLSKIWVLQVVEGSQYRVYSENNRFQYVPILSERGFIYSRDGKELAWNEVNEEKGIHRVYSNVKGIAHVVGYSKPPMKDSSGVFYREEYEGITGAEKIFDKDLNGENGLKFVEHDAQGKIYSENLIQAPKLGENIDLTIDAELQEALFNFLQETAEVSKFKGGAGVIMDIDTGDLLTAVTFPEYDSSVMSAGNDSDLIDTYINDERRPFLNRFSQGVFSPGSVVKPFMAVAALEEGIINPSDRVDSPFSISIPNPYNPSRPTVFRDWKTHGNVDLYEAIAFSSNIYFYKIGGGYQGIEGLGISRIEEYMSLFGFGDFAGSDFSESQGNVPTSTWKQKNFEDGVWRVGDTYHTSIGQFGFQTTPLQIVRAVASLANGGYLLKPKLTSESEVVKEKLPLKDQSLADVKEGMRLAVTRGTASGLNLSFVDVAAKTGTAQTGVNNQSMNSWIMGFFPYDNPKYAFTVVLDEGPSGTTRGGVYVMWELLEWISRNRPEYLENDTVTEEIN